MSEYSKSAMFDYNMLGFDQQPIPTYRRQTDYSDTLLVHAATALRPEEAFGLKWQDIDWQKGQIDIRRGWSKGKETAGKNEGSMTQVAMHPSLSQALKAWQKEARYARCSDWVFASNKTKGKTPRSAGVAGQDYLRAPRPRRALFRLNTMAVLGGTISATPLRLSWLPKRSLCRSFRA